MTSNLPETLAPAETPFDALRTPHQRPAAEQLLDPAAGTAAIGQSADGTTTAVPLWTEHGAVHLGVIGTTGAGASVILRHLWAAEAVSPLVTAWAAGFDQDLDHYHGPAPDRRACTQGQTRDLLGDAAETARSRHADASNWPTPYQPTEATPLLTVSLTLWELTRLDAMSMDLIGDIARFGRLAGVALRITYRRHHLDELGLPVRDALDAGALIALRGAERSPLGPLGPVIPRGLPGAGYLLSRRRPSVLFRAWAPYRQA